MATTNDRHRRTIECIGDGSCLRQKNDLQFYKNPKFTCSHNCLVYKCPHYIYCRTFAPAWVFNVNYGVCNNCLFYNNKISHGLK